MISLIGVSLVSVGSHYSYSTQIPILPFIILSLFAVLLTLFFVLKISSKGFMQYLLLSSISIFIGLGYYISSISLVVLFFIIDYFLEGIFDFFVSDTKDTIKEGRDAIEDIEDVDVDLIDID